MAKFLLKWSKAQLNNGTHNSEFNRRRDITRTKIKHTFFTPLFFYQQRPLPPKCTIPAEHLSLSVFKHIFEDCSRYVSIRSISREISKQPSIIDLQEWSISFLSIMCWKNLNIVSNCRLITLAAEALSKKKKI